jgi:hypothetical protein
MTGISAICASLAERALIRAWITPVQLWPGVLAVASMLIQRTIHLPLRIVLELRHRPSAIRTALITDREPSGGPSDRLGLQLGFRGLAHGSGLRDCAYIGSLFMVT